MSKYNKIFRFDQAVFSLFALSFVFLFSFTNRVSIYADDAGFIKGYLESDLEGKLESMFNYVPGRNLHILWQYFFFYLSDISYVNFWIYRIFQVLAFILIGYSVYKILMLVTKKKKSSLFFGLLSLYIPVYQEVYWWATALPQHIISTLLVLGMVYCGLRFSNLYLRFISINLLGILSIFTYDQSAGAAFAYLILEAFKYYHSSSKNFYRNFLQIFQMILLLIMMVIYILMVFYREGNGPGLSTGIFQRLLSNTFLPIHILSNVMNVSLFLVFIVFSIVTLLLFVYSVKNSLILRTYIKSVDYTFMYLSFAAYLPIAIWWVSPRHLFLPGILMVLWIGQATSNLKITNQLFYKFGKFLGVSILFFSIAISIYLSFEKSQSSLLRERIYSNLIEEIGQDEIGKYCYMPKSDMQTSNLFRYESIVAALSFYSSNYNHSRAECSPPTSMQVDRNKACFFYLGGNNRNFGWRVFDLDINKSAKAVDIEVYNECKVLSLHKGPNEN
jgi:hypothetical protein